MCFIGGVGHPLCVWGDRGMGQLCRNFGWRRDASLEQDCSLWDVSGQRDVGPSAASNPPWHSRCSDNAESHPSVSHLWAGWLNSGISLHTQLCFSLSSHSEGITALGTWEFHWFCGYGQWYPSFSHLGSVSQQCGGQWPRRGTRSPQAPAVFPPLESLCFGIHAVVFEVAAHGDRDF